ncbi:MAG: hypothetical protein ACTSRN_02490, partial [Alphaproteobacteria bacterium]
MLAEYVTQIQNNPDWITYGLALIAALVLLVLTLLIWRRADQVADALDAVAELDVQVENLGGQVTEQDIFFEIKDSGIGISEKDQERLFEKF